MSVKWKFAIAVAAILGAILYLFVSGFSDSLIYYVEVDEFLQQRDRDGARPVRINGTVLAGSIEMNRKENLLAFKLTNGKDNLSVQYRGAVPDLFAPDANVVIEGKSYENGVFVADSIITKCPSKYEPEEN